MPSGLTDLRDIGRYFAKIIVDERTVNKYVFVYNEVWTPNQVYDLLEKLSGEKLPRKFNSLETLQARVKDADEKLKTEPQNFGLSLQQVESQYQISWGIRGDNTPEHAKYLGYLDGKELYPDFKPRSLEGFLKDVLDGKMEPIYEHLRALVEELNKGQEGH